MTYWSDHSSLYQGLDDHQVECLEHAVRLQALGQYADSEKAFENLRTQNLIEKPIFWIEFSVLYGRMGYETKRAEILEEATSHAPIGQSQSDEITAWDLLTLLKANAWIYAYGILLRSRELLLDMSARLRRKMSHDYGDIEVQCLLEVHRLTKIFQETSNVIDDVEYDIQRGLPSVRETRRILQNLGRHATSFVLISAENSLDGRQDVPSLEPFEDFLPVMQEYGSSTRDPAMIVRIATVRILYARNLTRLGRRDDAEEQLQIAEYILERNENSLLTPRLQLLIDRVWDIEPSDQDIEESISKAIGFAERAEELQDMVICRFEIQSALTLARRQKEIVTRDDRAAAIDEFDKLLITYTFFEDETARCAFHLASAIGFYGLSFSAGAQARPNAFIEVLKRFEGDYPSFDIPIFARRLADAGLEAATQIQDSEIWWHYHELKQLKNNECPWMRKVGEEYVLKSDLSDEMSHMHWEEAKVDGTPRKLMVVCASLLLRWVSKELEDEQISQTQARDLLRLDSMDLDLGNDTSPQELCKKVVHIEPERLVSVLFGDPCPLEPSLWKPWFDSLRDWLMLPDYFPSTTQRQRLLKELQLTRANFCMIYARSLLANQKPETPEQFFEMCIRQLPFLQNYVEEAGRSLKLHIELYRIGSVHVSEHDLIQAHFQYAGSINMLAGNPMAINQGFLTREMLDIAVREFSLCIDEYESRREPMNLYRSCTSAGRLIWQTFMGSKFVEADECLPFLMKAEKAYRMKRRDDSILQPSRAFSLKNELAKTLNISLFNDIAVRAAVAAYVPFHESYLNWIEGKGGTENPLWKKKQDAIVQWSQISKARALTDLMGLTAQPPLSLQSSITGLIQTEKMLEKRLSGKDERISLTETIETREDLRDIQNDMREEPLLQSFLDIREGVALLPSEVKDLVAQFGDKAVIVDWIRLTGVGAELSMVIYREGTMRTMYSLKYPETNAQGFPNYLKLKDVTNWVEKNILADETPFTANPNLKTANMKLNDEVTAALVEPLLDCTVEGETLIFCPTRVIHRIPLHAIRLDGKPLIERNPILYVQSLSILRLCHNTVQVGDWESKNLFKATVFNTYRKDKATEDHINQLRQSLNAEVLEADACTKENFAARGAESTIIHVHGHAVFDEHDPLSNHLQLHDPARDDRDKLTANELFDMKLRRPSIVMAMGCKSGRSQESDCDDLFGLTASFHCAGASAVVSTLWSVHPEDCMRFAKAFYAHVRQRVSDTSDNRRMINLAEAMQKGVEAVRYEGEGIGRKPRAPYHWAAFVLHGSFEFPKQDLRAAS